MGFVAIAILVILIISAILLVLIVLIQDEEGEGIGGMFGGGSSTPFGSRSGNVLTRFTAVLAAVFMLCALALAYINKTPEAGNVLGRARQQGIATGQTSTQWWTQVNSGQTTGTAQGSAPTSTTAPAQSTGTSQAGTSAPAQPAGNSQTTAPAPSPTGQGGH